MMLPDETLEAFIRMMPVIQARESMRLGTALTYAVAQQVGDSSTASRIWSDWQQKARGMTDVVRTAEDDRKRFAQMVARLGVG